MAKRKTKNIQLQRKTIVFLLLTLLVFYLLFPLTKRFKDSFTAINKADFSYIFIAGLFVISSYLAAAGQIYFIVYFKLKYWRTVLVQIADGFTNRLLPAGAGGIATNAIYLVKQSKGRTKAGYVAGLNNLIGFLAHALLLFVLIIFSPTSVRGLFKFHISHSWLLGAVALFLIGSVVVVSIRRVRKSTLQAVTFISELATYSLTHLLKLLLTFICSVGVTFSYSAALYACMLALNVHIGFLPAFLALSAGVLSSLLVPTPGGLVGVEAAMTATFVALGVDPAQSLSVVLVFRMLTYWLPILPGFFALQIAARRRYV